MAADRFEIMRQRIQQQGAADTQDQTEAMKRRFAAAGGLSSGAGMRAENQVEQAGSKQLAQNLQGVDMAQAQEQFQTEEQQKQRDYGTGERVASQAYGSAEQQKQRDYGTGERVASQAYATGERGASEKFAAGQSGLSMASQERMFNKDYALKKSQFSEQMANNKSQFDQTYGLQVQRAGHEDEVDAFNKTMAERVQTYNEKPGILDKATSAFTDYSISGQGIKAGKRWFA